MRPKRNRTTQITQLLIFFTLLPSITPRLIYGQAVIGSYKGEYDKHMFRLRSLRKADKRIDGELSKLRIWEGLVDDIVPGTLQVLG